MEAFKQFEHDGWEQSVDAYDELFGPLTKEVVPPMLAELGVTTSSGGLLLDVATGPGYLATAANALGVKCVGIDISEAMIERAKNNDAHSAIDYRVSDAENLEALSNFDFVAMNFGILHLAQPEVAAKQAYQVLRPGGRFSFSVWAPPEQSIGFSIALRAIETHGSAAVKLPVGPPFFKYGTKDQGIALLTSAGFSSPKARSLSLVWHLPNAASLFQAFYAGTARTGGNLRAQPQDNLRRIQEAMEEEGAKYWHGADIQIPMVVWVYTGERFVKRTA